MHVEEGALNPLEARGSPRFRLRAPFSSFEGQGDARGRSAPELHARWGRSPAPLCVPGCFILFFLTHGRPGPSPWALLPLPLSCLCLVPVLTLPTCPRSPLSAPPRHRIWAWSLESPAFG